MRRLLTLAAGLAPAFVLAQAAPAPAPSARELHAAQCVAALELNTDNLALQVKAGKEELRPLLQARLEAGTAFVGDAYLHGNSDEARARQLADDAAEAQKSLSDAQLQARQLACADEGTKLLAAGNALERLIVKRLAKKRMARLLAR